MFSSSKCFNVHKNKIKKCPEIHRKKKNIHNITLFCNKTGPDVHYQGQKIKKKDNYSICFSIDAVACFFKRQYLNNLTMKYKNIFSSVFQEDMRVRCLFLSEARPSLVRSHSSKPKRRWPKHHLGLKKGS